MQKQVIRVGAYRLRLGNAFGASLGRDAGERAALPAPIQHAPPPPTTHSVWLVDRADERAQIAALLEADRVVRVAGAPGIGTTTVVRQIAADPPAEALPDRVLYLDESGGSVRDLVTRLFQLHTGPETAVKRLDDELRAALGPLRALIVLDGTSLSREELGAFAAFVPKSRVLAAESGAAAAEDPARVVLQPLGDADAVRLFEDTVRRPLAGAARDAAVVLCRHAGGIPALIRWVAALAAERRQLLPELAAEAGGPGGFERAAHAAFAAFTAEERTVVSLLAATRAAIPPDLLAAMTGAAALDDTLATLQRREITVADADGQRLVDGIASLLPPEWRTFGDRERVISAVCEWIEAGAGPAMSGQGAALAGRVLDAAFTASDWHATVRLGCAASDAFAVAGRWDAWRSALDHVRTAAGLANDDKHAAWALHQLGVRAFLLGQTDARPLLEEAFALRQSLGDAQGAAATNALLAHVAGPGGEPDAPFDVEPDQPAPTLWQKLAPYRLPALIALAVILALLLIPKMFHGSKAPAPRRPPAKVHHAGIDTVGRRGRIAAAADARARGDLGDPRAHGLERAGAVRRGDAV
ncbi:MAG: hypothetical protein JWM87_248 [Candidatus Eremiobacteraeota bacterium]|nr:hypothetical protein [Candidatus Eremiobacteraeota bacterium]